MHRFVRTINNNRGSVLVIGLLTLVLLTMIGMAATTTSSIEVQIAGNDRAYKEAFYAAEFGLSIAERTTRGFTSRVDLNEDADTTDGLYGRGAQPEWKTLNWNNEDSLQVSTADMPTNMQNVAARPRYTIEDRSFASTGTLTVGQVQPTGVYYFTITAQGVGSNGSTEVLLRTVYARQFN
jgi:type IV pilus assembly protein PilX